MLFPFFFVPFSRNQLQIEFASSHHINLFRIWFPLHLPKSSAMLEHSERWNQGIMWQELIQRAGLCEGSCAKKANAQVRLVSSSQHGSKIESPRGGGAKFNRRIFGAEEVHHAQAKCKTMPNSVPTIKTSNLRTRKTVNQIVDSSIEGGNGKALSVACVTK